MIKKIFKRIMFKIRGISNEQLTLNANFKNGMKVGKNVYGLIGCTIDYGHSWLIEIGDDVIFAPEVYLLAHDTSTKRSTGYTKIGKIKIGNNCFIGARVTIMPNVEIGENTIVGTNSVVVKSFPANVVIAGNPAKIICTIQEYENKIRKEFESAPKFDKSFTILGGITDERRKEMIFKMSENVGFAK